jgi:hypothetical protein
MVIFKAVNHMLSKADIEKYFMAEKQESLVFLVIGLAAVVLALVFHFMIRSPVYRGAAIPLVLLGLVQAFAGYSVYEKSDDQRIGQVYAYDMNPDQLKTTELTRMRRVKTNFLIYRWVEIGAILTGLFLFFLFRGVSGKPYWLGFGVALTLMAAELFIADFIAEKRAVQYINGLEVFNQKI